MTAELHLGDCLAVLKTFPDNHFPTIICDPPYMLNFMGKEFDKAKDNIAGRVEVWAECLRVAKPGATLLAFGGDRTHHRLMCAIEDAGWEIRTCVYWLFGCLSEDTEILIDGQWEPYHKAIAGKHALCYNVDSDSFEWQEIQELLVYDYEDTAYRIQSDSTDQIVSRNHRCLVEQGGDYVFQVAEQVARKRQARVPVLEDLPALLEALPVPRPNAGASQRVLQHGVSGRFSEGTEDGQATQATGDLSALRQDVLDAPHGAIESALLQPVMPSQSEYSSSIASLRQRQGQVATGQRDGGRVESSMEGRSNVLPQARQLQADQVCALPGGVHGDGAQRRLRDGASVDDSAALGTALTESRSRTPYQSRSNRQPLREFPTFCQQPRSQTVRASRFTRSDLATVIPIFYNGIVWCVRVPSGAFVARRNGRIFVTGNSGFPKSHNISKAIDRQRNDALYHVTTFIAAHRDAMGLTNGDIDRDFGFHGMAGHWTSQKSQPAVPTWEQWLQLKALLNFGDEMDAEVWRLNGRKGKPGDAWYEREILETIPDRWAGKGNVLQRATQADRDEAFITAPATDAAREWDGWGTALKPAAEIIVMAMKPLDGTFAENALRHGVAGLAIDRARIPTGDDLNGGAYSGNTPQLVKQVYGEYNKLKPDDYMQPAGRWPSNLILGCACEGDSHEPGCAVAMLDAQGISEPRPVKPENIKRSGDGESKGLFGMGSVVQSGYYDDNSRISRFFYCAKASKRDRSSDGTVNNIHPTCKPTSLMKYLCRLTSTPTGGTVLDPFMGSGSTGCAAVMEGRSFVGIEISEEYMEIARARIAHAQAELERTQPLLPLEMMGAD